MSRLSAIGKYAAVFIAGIAIAGIFILIDSSSTDSNTDYDFLADRLFSAQQDDLVINFTPLRDVMKSYNQESGIKAGVYFEYLPTGVSIGVNDQMIVEIASLTKVPVVMGAYKAIDEKKLRLDDTLVIQQDDIDSNFGNLWQRGSGAEITVEQAIDLALKDSDNTAANTLLSALEDDALSDVFDELDLPKTRIGPFPSMSPKSYASIFRNLYLSAYLEPASSDSVLKKLSETKYNDKLPAGIAEGVTVSHKIGVFQLNGVEVFNDCGIVYVPRRPYVLCVMVVADKDTAKKETIAYSKMVYSYVSQVKASKSLSDVAK